jgi:ribosomal protein S18 acetylase RimI-like enzyme
MISYRDATPEDGAMLGGIARATFIETFASLYKREDLEAFLAGSTDAAYGAELLDPMLEVRFAMVNDVPVGFCKVSPLKLPAPDLGRKPWELRQLYVFKPWHGCGIADELTQWAIERAKARGAEDLWLSVYTENPRGRRFYARYGFIEVQPYAFLVGSQADEDILCRKPLDV